MRNPQQANKTLFLRAWKAERGCRNCGEKDPIVLDCHHVGPKNPRLGRNRGKLSLQQLSWDDLMLELENCIALCANCHRRETARERGY